MASPYCVVEVHGGGRFRCAVGEGKPLVMGGTYASKAVSYDGLHPRWDERVLCAAERDDDAIVSIRAPRCARPTSPFHPP